MTDLQAEIERYLLDAGARWVPADELVVRFGLADDRELRSTDAEAGPLARIAIFSHRGFKHIRNASVQERLACKHRLKRELIARVRRLRWLAEGTRNCRTPATHPGLTIETHTGQMVAFL